MTIVVGADGSSASREALAWAIAEGRMRGTPVLAVRAWDAPHPSVAASVPFAPAVDELPADEFDALREAAEQGIAELLAGLEGGDEVGRRVLRGPAADVLLAESRRAELLVVGSGGHGALAEALLGSVSHACTQHAACPVVVVRAPERADWDPEPVIAQSLQQTAATWAALVELGVRPGDELALEFVYASNGEVADHELAAYLRDSAGYDVEVEAEGVSGQTRPMATGPALLDGWVRTMVCAGHEHGGCVFDGWTATVSAGV
jgi:nucleotide-binding universal stress UspA family protein